MINNYSDFVFLLFRRGGDHSVRIPGSGYSLSQLAVASNADPDLVTYFKNEFGMDPDEDIITESEGETLAKEKYVAEDGNLARSEEENVLEAERKEEFDNDLKLAKHSVFEDLKDIRFMIKLHKDDYMSTEKKCWSPRRQGDTNTHIPPIYDNFDNASLGRYSRLSVKEFVPEFETSNTCIKSSHTFTNTDDFSRATVGGFSGVEVDLGS